MKELDFGPIMKAFLSRPMPFVITFEKYKEYLSDTLNQSDIMSISLKYTNDIESLVSMIDKLGPVHMETSIKSRLKRLRKKLTQAPGDPLSQRSDSVTSVDDINGDEQDNL